MCVYARIRNKNNEKKITVKKNISECRTPLTLSDPGYFRQLTIPPPPYDLENCCVNLHHDICEFYQVFQT